MQIFLLFFFLFFHRKKKAKNDRSVPLSFDFSGPYWVSRVGGDLVVGRAAKAKMEDRKEKKKKKKKKKNQVGVAPPAPTTRARLLVFHCPKSTGTGPGTHGPWVDPHGATELEKKKMEGHQKKNKDTPTETRERKKKRSSTLSSIASSRNRPEIKKKRERTARRRYEAPFINDESNDGELGKGEGVATPPTTHHPLFRPPGIVTFHIITSIKFIGSRRNRFYS